MKFRGTWSETTGFLQKHENNIKSELHTYILTKIEIYLCTKFQLDWSSRSQDVNVWIFGNQHIGETGVK